MKIVEELTTDLHDDHERPIGHVYTTISAPSSLWEHVRGEWQKAPYWVHVTLSDGITQDGILSRAKTLDEARAEHKSRAWNYRLHLLGQDWP